MTPKTGLLWARTAYCSHLMMRVDFGDGRPVVMPQQWIASPPRLDASYFDPAILKAKA